MTEDEEEELGGGAGGRPAGEAEASLDELLTKKPDDRVPPGEEEDEESILSLGREERVESLAQKVVPPLPTEFRCRKCYLLKLRSQLADKRRMLCRDCA